MAKAVIYTPQMLSDMSTATLLKEVNRQAERLNKQITRAKKSGLYQSEEFKSFFGEPTRYTRFSTNKKNLAKYDKPSLRRKLIQEYTKREALASGGFTKNTIQKFKKELDAFNADQPEGQKIEMPQSVEERQQFQEAKKYSNSVGALYYQVLIKGRQSGLYDYNDQIYERGEKLRKKDIREFLKEENLAINDKIRQSDPNYKDKREGSLADLKRKAFAKKVKEVKARQAKERILKNIKGRH